MVKRVNIPMLLAEEDTYQVASKVHDLMVKIKPEDKDKIKIVRSVINKYVDIDRLLEKL